MNSRAGGKEDEDGITHNSCSFSASNSNSDADDRFPIEPNSGADDIKLVLNKDNTTFSVVNMTVDQSSGQQTVVELPINAVANIHLSQLTYLCPVPVQNDRYQREFLEIRKIGTGGFGHVAEVQHRNDKQYYAVKSISVMSTQNITIEKLYQEATILAKLTQSPRVVRYYGTWLEVSGGGQAPLKGSDMEKSTPSSSASSIEDSDNNLPGQSSSSIAFESSNETQVCRSMTNTTNSSLFSSSDSTNNSHSEMLGAVASRQPMTKFVLYIQMELCGETLSEWLRFRNEKLQSKDQFNCVNYKNNNRILRQILEGIDFIHGHGILHRDLKPLNIFLSEPQLDVKIGDFGLSREVICEEQEKTLDANRRSYGRKLTSCIGTPLYIAPEQLIGGVYDSKADMYSFGIINFEMFHPFTTGHEKVECINKLRDNGTIPDEIETSWPKEAEMIRVLTSKNKADRLSASDVLQSCEYCNELEPGVLQKQLSHRDSVILENEKKLIEANAEIEEMKCELEKRKQKEKELQAQLRAAHIGK